MEALFENPGLVPLLEYVFGNLDWKTFLQCRLVSKSVKNVIDNPHYTVMRMFRDGRKMYRHIANDITKIRTLLNEFPRQRVNLRVWSVFNFPTAYKLIFHILTDLSELEFERYQEFEWIYACQNLDELNYSFDKSISLYVMKKHNYLSEYQLFQSGNGIEKVLLGLHKLCKHESANWRRAKFLYECITNFSVFIMICVGTLYQNMKYHLPLSRSCSHCQIGNQEPIECSDCEIQKTDNYHDLNHLLELCIDHRWEKISEISKSKKPMSNIIEIMRQDSMYRTTRRPTNDIKLMKCFIYMLIQ